VERNLMLVDQKLHVEVFTPDNRKFRRLVARPWGCCQQLEPLR
jgi:hypothetical protein